MSVAAAVIMMVSLGVIGWCAWELPQVTRKSAEKVTGLPWKGVSSEEMQARLDHYVLLVRSGTMGLMGAVEAYKADVGAQYVTDEGPDFVTPLGDALRERLRDDWRDLYPHLPYPPEAP